MLAGRICRCTRRLLDRPADEVWRIRRTIGFFGVSACSHDGDHRQHRWFLGADRKPGDGAPMEAIKLLPLPEEERARLIAHIAVADAVCYLFGAVGTIWFCTSAGPSCYGSIRRPRPSSSSRRWESSVCVPVSSR
jgi:hypothetical protein